VGNRIHNSLEQNRPYEPGSHSEVNKLSAEHNELTNINVLKIMFGLFKSILLREICDSLLSEICIYQCFMRLNAPKYFTPDISKPWQTSNRSHCLTSQKTRIFIKQLFWRSVYKLIKITIIYGLWSLQNIKDHYQYVTTTVIVIKCFNWEILWRKRKIGIIKNLSLTRDLRFFYEDDNEKCVLPDVV
jgi:hypothetical protein